MVRQIVLSSIHPYQYCVRLLPGARTDHKRFVGIAGQKRIYCTLHGLEKSHAPFHTHGSRGQGVLRVPKSLNGYTTRNPAFRWAEGHSVWWALCNCSSYECPTLNVGEISSMYFDPNPAIA